MSSSSAKKFRIGERCDPSDFITFFLNKLHEDLGGTKKPGSSYIQQVFQGRLRMTSYTRAKEDVEMAEGGKKKGAEEEEEKWDKSEKELPMLFLPLDVPATPLFKNEAEKNIIPQVCAHSQ